MRRAYWRRIAYVKQQPFLLHDTVLYNVTLDGRRYDRDRLHKAACATGLLQLIESFAGRWDKVIAETGTNISGGQRPHNAVPRVSFADVDLLNLVAPILS